MLAAVRSQMASALSPSSGSAGRDGTPASTSAPAGVPTSTRKRCPASSMSSVNARSKATVARGPVPIDVQKHVLPAFAQSDEGVARCLGGLLRGKPQRRREQEALPRHVADVEAEERLVVAAPQPVRAPSCSSVHPAGRSATDSISA
jgi:hypothetical protein